MMTTEQARAKAQAKNMLEWYLQNKGINTRKNFQCLNPNHNDNKPSMAYKNNYCHCFSCGAHYDIFDLIGVEYNITSETEKFKKTYEILGIDVEFKDYKKEYNNTMNKIKNNIQAQQNKINKSYNEEQQEEISINITNEIEQAHNDLLNDDRALQHYYNRGLTIETIKKFKLGYAPAGHNKLLINYPAHQQQKGTENYKYILPYRDEAGIYNYFMAENKNNYKSPHDSPLGKESKYIKIKGIKEPLYNKYYLQDNKSNEPAIIFITEGIYDTLSIEQAGGKSIAIGGVGYNKLVEEIKESNGNYIFILLLDNDTAGKETANKLEKELNRLNISFIRANERLGKYKDTNDYLKFNTGAFYEFIENLITEAEEIYKQSLREYYQTSIINDVVNFMDNIRNEAENNKSISTGFKCLDSMLDGGLIAGLYIVGAISSLGKTTFTLQVLDNIAKAGTDVLIFSLEMSKRELIAKSISRNSYICSMQEMGTSAGAKTTRKLLDGNQHKNFNSDDEAILINAINEYGSYAERIFIYEGVGNIGVEEVKRVVENHIKNTGKKPVILIDYLQILAPYNERYTDKQNTDKAVLELKRISRDYNIPVLVISSFNRENYNTEVNLASFKESGAVEYSADVLIGLQYSFMGDINKQPEGQKRQFIQEQLKKVIDEAGKGGVVHVDIKILKNRNGNKGEQPIKFIPMFNVFKEY